MSEWEDKKQELLENSADEDEIATWRALYDDNEDGHDYR